MISPLLLGGNPIETHIAGAAAHAGYGHTCRVAGNDGHSLCRNGRGAANSERRHRVLGKQSGRERDNGRSRRVTGRNDHNAGTGRGDAGLTVYGRG